LAFQITPRRFSPPLLCRLPKAYTGSATVLVDELDAGGPSRVTRSLWNYL
jgi:hypothetical protein